MSILVWAWERHREKVKSYLVSEAIFRHNVHQEDVLCIGHKSRNIYLTMREHSPATHKAYNLVSIYTSFFIGCIHNLKRVYPLRWVFYLPGLVMIISVPISWKDFQSSGSSRVILMFPWWKESVAPAIADGGGILKLCLRSEWKGTRKETAWDWALIAFNEGWYCVFLKLL